jgi:hypothetical protein
MANRIAYNGHIRKALAAKRAAFFGADRDLYLHVGYFFAWYNNID